MIDAIRALVKVYYPLIFLFPVIIIGGAVIFHRAGLLRWPLRDIAYVAGCLSLAAGYYVVFGPPISLVITILCAPQIPLLAVMGSIVIVRKLLSSSYRSPSFWWFLGIAILSHAYTMFWLFAAGVPVEHLIF